MTDKRLKKLTRGELLQLLIEQMEQNAALEKELKTLRSELANRIIKINDAGSIAEASVRLSGVFEAAQDAADRYIESLQAAEKGARERADSIIAEAEQYSRKIRSETDAYWKQMLEKSQGILSDHAQLSRLVEQAQEDEEG